MFQLSPRTLLSPRFLALPIIALTIIVALAQTSRNPTIAGAQIAGPTVHRVINCADPAKATVAACNIARDQGSAVR